MSQWLINIVFGTVLRAIADVKQDIANLKETLMATFEDFVNAFNGFSDRQSSALAGISADIAGLKDQLAGQLTPSQSAALDAVLAKVQGMTEALETLDAQTPPIS